MAVDPSTASPRPVGRRAAVAAVLVSAVLAAVFSAVGIGARTTYGAQVSGDEPYYLLTALSLAEGGGLDIADELADRDFEPFHAITLDEQTAERVDGQRLSPHDPLLSVVLAPAMAVGGDQGWVLAKATLVAMSALLAGLTTWVAVRRFGVSPLVAVVVVGGLSAAMPLSAYGSQVYPELPAALAVMTAVAAGTAPQRRWGHLAVAAVAVMALPWLAIKYVPVAAAVALTIGAAAWRDGQRRAVVTVGAALALAGVAYLALHQRWYDGWTVYAAGDHFVADGELSVVGTSPNPWGRARRLVGLLVDRDFGIAAWSPLWFAAPAAVAVAIKTRLPHRALLLGGTAAGWLTATFVALTMHGWWAPGRQVVVVLPLLAIVVAVLVQRVWHIVAARTVVLVAAVAGAVNWTWLAVEAATGGPVLIVDFADSAAPFRRLISALLPDGRAGGVIDDLGLVAWGVALLATAVVAWRPSLARRPSRSAVLSVSGLVVAVAAVAWAVPTLDPSAFEPALASLRARPGRVLVGLAAFGAAFLLRAEAWHRVCPGLSRRQALAGIHLALGGNHVLPLRLGEPLRVLSVVRRAGIDPATATASTVLLRSADVLALLVLGLIAGPTVVAGLLGPAGGAVALLLALAGIAAGLVVRRRWPDVGAKVPTAWPGAVALLLTVAAWLLEAVLVWAVAATFDVALSPADAIVVLAAAISGQLLAVTPGGIGTYEVAAAAGLGAAGVPVATGLALALGLHAIKTLYSVIVGAIALVLPRPGLLGNLRLPRVPTRRPAVGPVPDGPVVLFLPAHNEGPRVADVIGRAPATVAGRDVVVAVVDDGSADDTVPRASAAGATVVSHPTNLGLGAAVRTGLAWAVGQGAAAVAFCDADGEYDPAELERLVAPILAGDADYVGGSRFAGDIQTMRPHRRLGNIVLTRWVRWTVRQPVTDGQTGYRAFSRAAARAARVPHDYNYAQVITIDLLTQGFVYAEVPITYRFRESGRSFIRLGRYLRRVVPTVWRQLNTPPLAS